MSKKYFCSFADKRLHRSLRRISMQASEMNLYDKIYVFDENSLDTDFKQSFSKYLRPGVRGFGFWSWKPQIILQVLEKMENGDLLQYTDSGCHLNPNGQKRLLDYFEMTEKSDSGILAFRSKSYQEKSSSDLNPIILEYQYTKGDVIQHFGVVGNKNITHTPQFQGGIIFIRKDDSTITFVKKWLSAITTDFNLIDDSPSVYPNFAGFIENRHDQSVFSILCKLSNVSYLFTNEYYSQNEWDDLSDKPIWVKWDKDFGIYERVRNYIKRKLKIFFSK